VKGIGAVVDAAGRPVVPLRMVLPRVCEQQQELQREA
jgi:hypothetical protein